MYKRHPQHSRIAHLGKFNAGVVCAAEGRATGAVALEAEQRPQPQRLCQQRSHSRQCVPQPRPRPRLLPTVVSTEGHGAGIARGHRAAAVVPQIADQ